MSEYGRLWQRVADIRDELKQLAPSASTNTLQGARLSTRHLRDERIERLLARWEILEREMADAPE
jgi:hypothetical protein